MKTGALGGRNYVSPPPPALITCCVWIVTVHMTAIRCISSFRVCGDANPLEQACSDVTSYCKIHKKYNFLNFFSWMKKAPKAVSLSVQCLDSILVAQWVKYEQKIQGNKSQILIFVFFWGLSTLTHQLWRVKCNVYLIKFETLGHVSTGRGTEPASFLHSC